MTMLPDFRASAEVGFHESQLSRARSQFVKNFFFHHFLVGQG